MIRKPKMIGSLTFVATLPAVVYLVYLQTLRGVPRFVRGPAPGLKDGLDAATPAAGQEG